MEINLSLNSASLVKWEFLIPIKREAKKPHRTADAIIRGIVIQREVTRICCVSISLGRNTVTVGVNAKMRKARRNMEIDRNGIEQENI